MVRDPGHPDFRRADDRHGQHARTGKSTRTLKTYLRNKTFIMVTHRTTLLPLVDRLDAPHQGPSSTADGPRDEVLRRLGRPARPVRRTPMS
jgi:ABC-type bacteriocin/lantibiotic exporter with double-glycine peptidase domain